MTSKYPQIVAKNLLTTCWPLLLSTLPGMPNGTIQWCRKMFAISFALASAVGTARVSLKYLSVNKITYLFPCMVYGRLPRISIPTLLVVRMMGITRMIVHDSIDFCFWHSSYIERQRQLRRLPCAACSLISRYRAYFSVRNVRVSAGGV